MIGAQIAQGAAQPPDHAQIEVAVNRDARHRNARRRQFGHHIIDGMRRVFEQQQRHVHAARLERGQQDQQVAFRAGDARRLDDVDDFHRTGLRDED